MKKIFNKLFFFLLTFIASFVFASNVFAFSKGEYIGHDYYSKPLKSINNAVKGTGYSTYSMYPHYTYYGSTKYNMYCLDPARKSGGSNASLHVSRVLDQNEPKDAVTLAIISDPSYSVYEKTIAIRAWIPFNGDLSRTHTITSYEYSEGIANANSGVKWAASDPESMKTIFNLENPTQKNIANIAYLYKSYSTSVILNDSNSTIKRAKDLFLKSLKYGASIANRKGINKKKISYSAPSFTKDKYEIIEENGLRKAVREITFSETFTKFNDGTTDPVTININADTKGSASAIKYEYQVYGADAWTEFNSNTDFKPLLDKDSVTINFRVLVKAAVTTKSSFNINFKVITNFKDEKILTGALVYNTKNTNKPTQRFYIYDEETNKHSPLEATLKWDDIVGYCANVVPNTSNTDEFKDYLKACCRGQDGSNFNISDECHKDVSRGNTFEEQEKIRKSSLWCQRETMYCDVCNGTISVPQTCSEFGDGETPKCEDNADAIVKDNDNIKLCVIDYSDQAGNDYKMMTDANVASNDYCNVYCKEDYKISLPLGRWVTAGRTFTFGMNLNDTKTCYTDLINYDKFITDLNAAKAMLDANVNSASARANYKKILTQYKTCAEASWNSDIKFDEKYQTISLTYDEKEYIDKFQDHEVKFNIGSTIVDGKSVSTKKVSNDNIWLCGGSDVDDYYNSCINGKAVSQPENQIKQTLYNFYDPDTFNKTNLEVPLTKYAKKTSFASAVYVPTSNLYSKVGNGVVSQNPTNQNVNQKLVTDIVINGEVIPDVGALPVALKRTYGAYKFNIYFNGIGEYYNSNLTGRLVGGTNSVALKDNHTTFKGKYVCSYTVNCPECKVGCTENPSKGVFCSIGDKDIVNTCVDCKPNVIDNIDMFIARQISLNNVNPTGRDLGINLNTAKGKTAVKSIEEKGEGVYNGNNGKAEYTITLTPSETRKLQQYNNLNISNGGYASLSDFDCYPYSSTINKNNEYYEEIKKHDYIVCKSKLLDSKGSNEYTLRNIETSNSDNVSWVEACNKSDNTICIVGGFYGPAYR